MRVRVEDPGGLAAEQAFVVQVSLEPPPTLESILVTPATPTLLTGQAEAFVATGILSNGSSEVLTPQVTWQSSNVVVASIDASGSAFTLADGVVTISATKGRISGSTTLTVRSRGSDRTPPTVEITSPADGADVTEPVPVIGTATDANFLKYVLDLAPVGQTAFTTLATGTTPVAAGTLGTLDPTVLINDLYTLRLTVYDRGGTSCRPRSRCRWRASKRSATSRWRSRTSACPWPACRSPSPASTTAATRRAATSASAGGWTCRRLRLRESGRMGSGWAIDYTEEPRTVRLPHSDLYALRHRPHKAS